MFSKNSKNEFRDHSIEKSAVTGIVHDKESIAWTLFGAMPDTVTLEEARDMRCREV